MRHIRRFIKTTVTVLFVSVVVCLRSQNPIIYTVDDGLPSNNVYTITQDTFGFIWMATNRGVVNYDGEKFKTYTVANGLPNNDIRMLRTDQYNRVWFLSKSNYIGYFRGDSVTLIEKDSSKFDFSIVDHKIHDKIEKEIGVDNIEYVAKVTKEISIVKTLDKFFIYYQDNKMLNEINLSKAVSEEFLDKVLNNQKDIRSYHITKTNLVIQCKDAIINFDFESNVVFANRKLKNTSWIYCNNNHKRSNEFIQLLKGSKLLVLNNELSITNSFSFDLLSNVSDALKDRFGNLWVSTLGNGVYMYSNLKLEANHYFKNYSVNRIGVLDNKLFAGINNRGYYVFDEKLKNFYRIFAIKSKNNMIHQIESFNKNSGYLVSDREAYNVRSPNAIALRDKRGELMKLRYVCLTKKILLGIEENGVYLRRLSSWKIDFIEQKNLFSANVYQGKIYLMGTSGVYLLDYDNKSIVPSGFDILQDKSVKCSFLNESDFLIGTDGYGIYVCGDNGCKQLSCTNGIIVQKIIANNDSTILTATSNGVFKISYNSNTGECSITNIYNKTDGLLQNNINDICFYNNLLYVATDDGLTSIDINSVNYSQELMPYFKTIEDTLVVSASTDANFSIAYGTINYTSQNYLKYNYRLLPRQTKWTSTPGTNLTFSNLDPGYYTLELKVMDQHQNFGVNSKMIYVKPLWWQIGWVKILLLLLAILFLISFIAMTTIYFNRKKMADYLQEKRLSSLKLSALRSQMNPHFVHNSLNAIQYYIQQNDVKLSEQYLTKFSRLIRLFFEFSRKPEITIAEELELLIKYLEIEQLRFEDKLNFTVEHDNLIDIDVQLIPTMLLQPIVENAVNHGIFHKKGNGKISVLFEFVAANVYRVVIEDDGIGVKKAREIQEKSSKNYRSKSSDILKERLELLEQNKEWCIKQSIIDLEENFDKQGTRVEMIFEHILI